MGIKKWLHLKLQADSELKVISEDGVVASVLKEILMEGKQE